MESKTWHDSVNQCSRLPRKIGSSFDGNCRTINYFLFSLRRLDLLRTADLLGNGSMMLRVLAFLRDRDTRTDVPPTTAPTDQKEGSQQEVQRKNNVADENNEEDEEALQVEFPGLSERLQLSRMTQNPLPPPRWLLQEAKRRKQQAQEQLEQQTSRAFPLWALLIAFACIVVYRYVNTVIVLGPYIFVVNGIAVAVGIAIAFQSLKN